MKGKRPATPDEIKALANPLRLRILRLCLDEALTNKELAEELGIDPGTSLHHVRTLVRTDFLAPEPMRRGARGAVERPYRATGKSWTLEMNDETGLLAGVDAFRAELAEVSADDILTLSRLGPRLRKAELDELHERLEALVMDFYRRSDPRGQPVGLFVGLHRRRRRGKRHPAG
jgi:predicted ArsR family transcriptional regulator